MYAAGPTGITEHLHQYALRQRELQAKRAEASTFIRGHAERMHLDRAVGWMGRAGYAIDHQPSLRLLRAPLAAQIREAEADVRSARPSMWAAIRKVTGESSPVERTARQRLTGLVELARLLDDEPGYGEELHALVAEAERTLDRADAEFDALWTAIDARSQQEARIVEQARLDDACAYWGVDWIRRHPPGRATPAEADIHARLAEADEHLRAADDALAGSADPLVHQLTTLRTQLQRPLMRALAGDLDALAASAAARAQRMPTPTGERTLARLELLRDSLRADPIVTERLREQATGLAQAAHALRRHAQERATARAEHAPTSAASAPPFLG